MSREHVLKYTRDTPMLAMGAFVALVAVGAPDDVLATCPLCGEVVRLASHMPAVLAFGRTNPSPGVAELVLALAVLLPWCTWPWFAYWSFTCLDYSRLANMGALWRWVLLVGSCGLVAWPWYALPGPDRIGSAKLFQEMIAGSRIELGIAVSVLCAFTALLLSALPCFVRAIWMEHDA